MANNVQKPKSTNYLTKLTSQTSFPSGRDHQYNSNQTIPTITTKDQAIDIPPNFIDTYDTATTTATTAGQNPHEKQNQNNSSEMTLEEEMQQYENEHYAAEDRVEEAARPKSKVDISRSYG